MLADGEKSVQVARERRKNCRVGIASLNPPYLLTAFALGEGKVFVLSGGSLLGDVPVGARWKL